MSFRHYNLILAAVLVPVIVLLAITSAFLQPYEGALTRLGGYPEKLYGWNQPQMAFFKPLYRQFTAREAEYREPADVLIVGDSFTFSDDVSWPNYLVQQTGLRVQGFRLDRLPLERLLDSATFREHPPRVVIFESVERELWARLHAETSTCRARPSPVPVPLATHLQPAEMVPFQRDTRAALLDFHKKNPGVAIPATFQGKKRSALLDFSLSVDYLSKVVPREYFGRDRTSTRRFALLQDASFSSVEKRQLLVYRDDLDKTRWTPAMWETIRCNLADMQNRVQANGRTFFVAMVAPDKLTAYSELLADRRVAALSRIDLLAADPGLHLPRLDLRLQRAIREDVTDVYLNNDTHWGSAGYAVVAQELVEFLTRARVIAPPARR
jgi:hypothetical protein